MRGEMSVMGPGGHLTLTWDAADPASVAEAEQQFADLTRKGYSAFQMNADGSTGKQISTFDPTAPEIVLVGPVAGGRDVLG